MKHIFYEQHFYELNSPGLRPTHILSYFLRSCNAYWIAYAYKYSPRLLAIPARNLKLFYRFWINMYLAC